MVFSSIHTKLIEVSSWNQKSSFGCKGKQRTCVLTIANKDCKAVGVGLVGQFYADPSQKVEWFNSYLLNTSSLSHGLYLLKIQIEN